MYLVIEIQMSGSSLAHLVTTHQTRADAESKFHTILASAAISSVELHSAVMLNTDGSLMKRESYHHDNQQ